MKLINLIWVLALAGSVAACNSGPPIQGCSPGEVINADGQCERENGAGGTGGGTGTGGGGGAVGGACTNPDDAAVYADLSYINDDNVESTGSDSASDIASDCVFGSTDSTPNNPGCADQAGDVLACALFPGRCTDEEFAARVAALTDCVVNCQQDLIEDITGSRLTDECNACYGDSVACSAALCATENCSSPNSSQCIACRCREGCTPGFDVCSGLPPSGDCD